MPAWTDRILYRGNSIRLLEYTRGELLQSDHRPVRGVFSCAIKQLDHEKMAALRKQLYDRDHNFEESSMSNNTSDLLGVKIMSISDEIPLASPSKSANNSLAPSSDEYAWWNRKDIYNLKEFDNISGTNPFFDFSLVDANKMASTNSENPIPGNIARKAPPIPPRNGGTKFSPINLMD